MPYKIVKNGACYVNKDTGKVHSKCSTKTNAEKQKRLLYGIHGGWSPIRKRSKARSKSRRRSKSRSKSRRSKSRKR